MAFLTMGGTADLQGTNAIRNGQSPITSTQQLVDSYASTYGVPNWILEDIVQVESRGNPSATGDNGTSFGLLQLHWGGQGTVNGQNMPASYLQDPNNNLTIGTPPIADAYRAGIAKGLVDLPLLEYTASHSGHPSYTGVWSTGYQTALDNVYNGTTQTAWGISQGSNIPSNQNNSATAFGQMSFDFDLSKTGVSGVLYEVDKLLKPPLEYGLSFNGDKTMNPAKYVFGNMGSWLLRTVVVVIGFLLLFKTIKAL